MRISDAQLHMWEAPRPDRPWDPSAKPHLAEPATAERLLAMMDEVGVQRAVISPLYLPGNGPEYALEMAAKYPDRFKVMGWYQPADPTALSKLEHWLDDPGMCSIRLNLNEPNARYLADGSLEPFWAALERYRIPIGVFRMGGVDLFGEIAARHPGLRLIIDHLGMPTPYEERESRIDELVSLAAYPNVAVKVSALPNFSNLNAPFDDVHVLVRRVYEAFGAKRLMWGSDHTQQMAKGRCTYQEHLDIIRVGAAAYLPPADLQQVLSGTFAEWFGWPE